MFTMIPEGVFWTTVMGAPRVIPRFSRWLLTLGEPPIRMTVRTSPDFANAKGMMASFEIFRKSFF
jgi:hypothetical protein